MTHSPAHIGEFVHEILGGHDLTISAGARILGVTRQTLSTLVNCDGGLSSDMALRIEKAFGVDMALMLRMQTSYEIAAARNRASTIHVERFESVTT